MGTGSENTACLGGCALNISFGSDGSASSASSKGRLASHDWLAQYFQVHTKLELQEQLRIPSYSVGLVEQRSGVGFCVMLVLCSIN